MVWRVSFMQGSLGGWVLIVIIITINQNLCVVFLICRELKFFLKRD